MAQTPQGIGGTDANSTLSRLTGWGSVGPRPAGSRSAPAVSGTSPNGPRGRRMLSPDTPVSQLDHSAPRGTYLDILV